MTWTFGNRYWQRVLKCRHQTKSLYDSRSWIWSGAWGAPSYNYKGTLWFKVNRCSLESALGKYIKRHGFYLMFSRRRCMVSRSKETMRLPVLRIRLGIRGWCFNPISPQYRNYEITWNLLLLKRWILETDTISWSYSKRMGFSKWFYKTKVGFIIRKIRQRSNKEYWNAFEPK